MAVHKYYLKRFHSGKDATLGMITREGGMFVCFTLEDEYREIKVPGETRIPAGNYQIKLRNEGGLATKYFARFPEWHKGMLHLQNVPGFEWVYLHIGNTDKHSEGCPLVGNTATWTETGGVLGNSEAAYKRLYLEFMQWFDKGDMVWLRVE